MKCQKAFQLIILEAYKGLGVSPLFLTLLLPRPDKMARFIETHHLTDNILSIAPFAITINSNVCPHIRDPNTLMRDPVHDVIGIFL